jgi:TatA/E family protein of Tat protein translocase
MFPHISLPEIIVIGILAIIFFGKDKLPEAAASFGKALKSFKKEISDVQDTVKNEVSAIESAVKLEEKKVEVVADSNTTSA